MKGKINKAGHLIMNRAGDIKPVECPHQSDYANTVLCTDACALFYEDSYKSGKFVKLCNGATIEIIGDER